MYFLEKLEEIATKSTTRKIVYGLGHKLEN